MKSVEAAFSFQSIGYSHMHVLRLSLFSTVLLAATACAAAPSAAAPSSAPAAAVSPVPSPSPVAASLGSGPSGVATPALPAATVDVSPAEVQAGSLSLSLSVERARHMVDQSMAAANDPDPAHQASSDAASAAGSTAFVLQGMLQLTNNFNPAQEIPDDMPQMMVRHINLQIHNGAAADTTPYLSTSMDVLLDGHPVVSNIPLVPMVGADAAPAVLYYGNNVKLTQRGAYQFFVRVQPSPLLGKDALPTAQFNVAVH
jgi:hypothetical protein